MISSPEAGLEVVGSTKAQSPTSRAPGFYRLSLAERRAWLIEHHGLSAHELDELGWLTAPSADPACPQSSHQLGLRPERADKMVENCIGVFGLPVGLGLNFVVNQREYVIPMVVEEPSVIAAVSHVARLARPRGGFRATSDEGVMIAQVQVVGCEHWERAASNVREAEAELLSLADQIHPNLKARGGGARGIEVRVLQDPHPMLIVHFLIDCVDAMGANAVNSIAEGAAPRIEALTGGRVYLRILSNLADRRLARAEVSIDESRLATAGMTGAEVAEGIVHAYQFADVDPYRAATHNKGIMNGIDAVIIATGNDWRGVEAGAHAFAARTGRYRSLTRFWREDGALWGEIELPMAVATVGGSTEVHPSVKTLRKLLGVQSARELAEICASVGLAQNLGALKALATEGIQRGHMSLHARSVALAVGATEQEVDRLSSCLVNRGQIKLELAKDLLAKLRAERTT